MDKLQAFANLIKSLSWVKIAELSVLLILLSLGLAFYENRQAVYDSVGANSLSEHAPNIKISERSSKEMTELVNRSPVILGLQVIEVDFVKNSRRTVFVNIDDQILNKAFETYFKTKLTDAPAITLIEHDNKRLVRLVNGEFVCLPYKDTIGQVLVGGGDSIGAVCSLAVPPIYGKFRGYITAFLSKTATISEQQQIKIALQNLSMNIYNGK